MQKLSIALFTISHTFPSGGKSHCSNTTHPNPHLTPIPLPRILGQAPHYPWRTHLYLPPACSKTLPRNYSAFRSPCSSLHLLVDMQVDRSSTNPGSLLHMSRSGDTERLSLGCSSRAVPSWGVRLGAVTPGRNVRVGGIVASGMRRGANGRSVGGCGVWAENVAMERDSESGW